MRKSPPEVAWIAATPYAEIIRLELETVTTVYGGGSRSREVDGFDPIRGASIRGHLRQWWRALHGPRYAGGLLEREREIWGGISRDTPCRSMVTVAVEASPAQEIDKSDVRLGDRDAYALFVARAEVRRGTPPGQRIVSNTQFVLTVGARSGAMSDEVRSEVLASVRAWILFGGIGGRTRRGVGSIGFQNVNEAPDGWLPASAEALRKLDLLAPNGAAAGTGLSVCTLADARIHVGAAAKDSSAAWHTALGWLRNFRQKNGLEETYARRQGRDNRPGQTRWPEPDKLRRLGLMDDGHPLVYNATPAWPRANFGLPIQVTFSIGGSRTTRELIWTDGTNDFKRLMSPLVVKPVQLADGTFVPMALWMKRTLPSSAKVFVMDKKTTIVGGARVSSQAGFDVVTAPGDTAKYAPLRGMASVEEAFFNWVNGQ